MLVVQTLYVEKKKKSQAHARSRGKRRCGAHLVRVSSVDDHVSLEQLQTDDTVHGPLTRRNRARQEFTLGREKVAIVENPAESDREELVAERADVTI